MRNTLSTFAVIFTTCAASVAHGAPATSGAAPAESPGLLKKIFGSRQGQRVTFAPAPKAEPKAAPPAPAKPKVKPKKKSVTKAKASGSADAPTTDQTAKPADAPQPASPPVEPDASATPAPAPDVVAPPPVAPPVAPPRVAPSAGKKKGKGKAPAAAPAVAVAPADADAEAKEQARFDEVKAKATIDPGVAELKTKADASAFDEEGKNAQRAYNKALFEQMRKLDSSLEGRINSMEALILKKLNE
ncbi:MAG: hypothetical protein DVB27_02050 [Verrucomicrobia bacterium]|nr:MAG: hypothetical protein DVB27_02050 [Verrucomicrobiota bacterium]